MNGYLWDKPLIPSGILQMHPTRPASSIAFARQSVRVTTACAPKKPARLKMTVAQSTPSAPYRLQARRLRYNRVSIALETMWILGLKAAMKENAALSLPNRGTRQDRSCRQTRIGRIARAGPHAATPSASCSATDAAPAVTFIDAPATASSRHLAVSPVTERPSPFTLHPSPFTVHRSPFARMVNAPS